MIIIGGIPSPVGGVTTFIRRFALNQPAQTEEIVDLYPGNKEPLPADVSIRLTQLSSPSALLAWLWLRPARKEVLFFNFSRARALFLLALAPKKRGSEWRLMLHHGDIGFGRGITRIILIFSVKKFDKVYALSERQQKVYNTAIDRDRIVLRKSYCPANITNSDKDAIAEMTILRQKYKRVLVMSGYPLAYYNYDIVLDALDRGVVSDTCLAIFIYGKGDMRHHLRGRCAELNAVLFEDRSEAFFNTFLADSDGLLRLTDIDSFGVSVADAVNFNVPVLATAVTERYPGVSLIERDGLEKRIDEILWGFPASLASLPQSPPSPNMTFLP